MKNRKRWMCFILSAAILFTNTAVFAAEEPSEAPGASSESTQQEESSDEIRGSITEVPDSGAQNGSDGSAGEIPAEKTEDRASTEKSAGDGISTETSAEGAASAEEATEVRGQIVSDVNNDEVEIEAGDKPYLALGANLTEEQRSTVLSLMGIDPANLSDYDVVYITNEEEHQYLDSYVAASKIGTKSLSSVVIVKREKGNGIHISTQNINYCTVGMYKNALATAGIQDADIIIAGPTPISGTAALVGIFKAYQQMTGEAIKEEVVDAALNELILTGQLKETIDGLEEEEVEEFIAYIKSVIAERELTDEDDINEAIDEACKRYKVTLSEEERQQIVDLLLKITSLGIDLSGLVDYAESLYNIYKGGGSSGGILSSIGQFFSNIFSAIGDFFKNLFN